VAATDCRLLPTDGNDTACDDDDDDGLPLDVSPFVVLLILPPIDEPRRLRLLVLPPLDDVLTNEGGCPRPLLGAGDNGAPLPFAGGDDGVLTDDADAGERSAKSYGDAPSPLTPSI
jgi:hypothetical protein